MRVSKDMDVRAAQEAEQIAKDLDRAGYIIVPKPYQKPARRGNDAPDPWIGKSHTANLIGG